MSDKCRSCGSGIQWALTPKGHRIPLDPAPVDHREHGAMVLVPDAGKALTWAYSFADLKKRLLEASDVAPEVIERNIISKYEARLSHFSTCPNAAQHRRRNS